MSGNPIEIAVVGPGGVGGFFGAQFVEAGHRVHFLGRGPHLSAMREKGLRVIGPDYDRVTQVDASEQTNGIGQCDFVLFCVKTTDTTAAAEMIVPLLGSQTAVISFQNGVDNESRIEKIVGNDHVVGGAAFVFASIDSPGTIRHAGGVARLVFGEMNGTSTPRIRRFHQLCTSAGIDCEATDDITSVLWKKYALICAVAGMTAASRVPIGSIRSSKESLQMLRDVLSEVIEVAQAEQVNLTADTVDQHLAFISNLPEAAYSSLHYDLVEGKPMELEALHGNLVRMADRLGVPVPMNRAIYAVLKPAAAHRP